MRKDSVIVWLSALIACLPLLLVAYLGSFIRLINDDYYHLAIGRDLGPWESMLHWHNSHNGSYTHYFLHGIVTPLDTLVPAFMPAVIIVLWLTGIVWLNLQILSYLNVCRNRLPISIALAGLVLMATIHGFYTLESIFWYSASTRYTLPVAILTLYFAANFAAANRFSNPVLIGITAATGGGLCFVNAGLSEMYLVVQLLTLFLVVLLVPLLSPRNIMKKLLVLFLAGFLATLASAIVYSIAPGVSARMENALVSSWANPVRLPPELLRQTLISTFQYVGHQKAFAGFMLLFGAGLFVSLSLFKSPSQSATSITGRISGPAHLLVLLGQLCLFPFLWSHSSDNPLVFGRFSYVFTTVIFLNISHIIVYCLMLWKRQLIGRLLRATNSGLMTYCMMTIFAMIVLFGLTQIRAIHHKAATYLFLSSLLLLASLCWQLSTILSDERVLRFGLCAAASSALAVISIVPMAAISNYVFGIVFSRILAHAAFLQVVSGLIWGVYLGFLIQRVGTMRAANRVWITRFKTMGLLLVLSVSIGISVGQARLIPEFSTYTTEWNNRHELLIRLSEMGRREVAILPFTFDMSAFITTYYLRNEGMNYATSYYDLDSIQVVNDEN